MWLSLMRLHGRRENLWRDLLAVVLLMTSVTILYQEVLLQGRALFGSDFLFYFYPVKKFIFDSLWTEGSLPFWNPYQFSGTPFIANIQGAMFYPPGLLYYIMPPEKAYTCSTILHSMAGGLFMYFLAREIQLSAWAAFLSAYLFISNGYYVGHIYAGHLSFVQAYIWIPIIFFFLYRFIGERRMKWAAACGLCLGIQILGGFPQISFYTILGIWFFGIFYGFLFFRQKRAPSILRLTVGLFIITGLGFSLSAIQLMPTWEFSKLSTRAGGVSYEYATSDSLHPKEFLALLVPDIFGHIVDVTYWRTLCGWHFWETCGYMGILPLCLLFYGIREETQKHLRSFWVILALLSLFLALGKYNPLYPIVYRLPGFQSFRIPAQILFLFVFALSLWAGICLDHLGKAGLRSKKRFVLILLLIGIILVCLLTVLHQNAESFFHYLFKWFKMDPSLQVNLSPTYLRTVFGLEKAVFFWGVSCLLIFFKKKQWIGRPVFMGLISLSVMTDVGSFGMQFVRPYEYEPPPAKSAFTQQLAGNPSEGRIVTSSPLFDANDGLLFRFPSITGYDPLILRRYLYYLQASQDLAQNDAVINLALINDPTDIFLKLLNVTKAVLKDKFYTGQQGAGYASFVKRTVLKSSDDVLPFMRSDGFDPTEMVVLESEQSADLMSQSMQKSALKAEYSVLSYKNEEIQIKVSANQPCYLVLSEIFYPGWKAEIDGKERPILRGNYVFRVLPIDEGSHAVRLFFVSWPFRIGAAISLCTLIIALLILFSKRRIDS